MTSVDSLRTTLRQVTLSMDGPNKLIPLTARPPTGLVLHYVAQSRVTGGETLPGRPRAISTRRPTLSMSR